MENIRDNRPSTWFWLNKSIIDDYGARIGVQGIAIYALLAKCANDSNRAIPSVRYIAKKLSLSTTTVLKYLDVLVAEKLIDRHHRYAPDGDFSSTEYTLLAMPEVPIGGVSGGGTPVSGGGTLVYQEVEHGVSGGDTEQDPLNKTNYEQDLIHPPTPLEPTALASEGAGRPAEEVERRFAARTEEVARVGGDIGEWPGQAAVQELSLLPTNNPSLKPPKKGGKAISHEAGQVLDHLNLVTRRGYRTVGKIQARLNDGSTVEECCRVIDYINATWSAEFKDKYLDQDSPFRPDNFDKHRAKSLAWRDQRGRETSTDAARLTTPESEARRIANIDMIRRFRQQQYGDQ